MAVTASSFSDNPGLRMQCGMMLDEFPSSVTASIESVRDDCEAIRTIIMGQPTSMIDGYFSQQIEGRYARVNAITEFIHAFFAYRKTLGK